MIEIAGGIVLAVLFLALLPYLPLLLLFALCGIAIIAGVVLAIGLVVAAPAAIATILAVTGAVVGLFLAAERLRDWRAAKARRRLAAAVWR